MFNISPYAIQYDPCCAFDWRWYSWLVLHLCSHWLLRPIAISHPMHRCLLKQHTVYPKKYAHGFVVLCFAVVMQSFIMNSHEVFIHIHQGCFAGTGAIVRLLQCQWSKPDGYGKTSQCITTTKHSKAKTVSIFFGIYCIRGLYSLSGRTSYRKISWSLEVAGLDVIMIVSLWNMTGISTSRCLPDLAIGKV